MTRIIFGQQIQPPSWSWLAYLGDINYLVWDEKPQWDASVTLENGELKARVKKLQKPKIISKGQEQVLQDENGCEVGQLWFDCELMPLEDIWCVIIGKRGHRGRNKEHGADKDQRGDEDQEAEEGQGADKDQRGNGSSIHGGKRSDAEYYVLIVAKSATAGDAPYKRVGTGLIAESCISFEGDNEAVLIV